MLCAIQPAFLLWHILWLLPVQGFILKGTKAGYHFHFVPLCGRQMENPSCHQKMCSADWSWVSTGWEYQGAIEPTLFRKQTKLNGSENDVGLVSLKANLSSLGSGGMREKAAAIQTTSAGAWLILGLWRTSFHSPSGSNLFPLRGSTKHSHPRKKVASKKIVLELQWGERQALRVFWNNHSTQQVNNKKFQLIKK